MSEAPERMWAWETYNKKGQRGGQWCSHTKNGTEYVRADLLPVVKPLVWEDFQDRGSKSYVFGRACYLITRWSDGQFELCESYPGYQGARIGKGFFDTMKAAKAAAQADHDARIRACLDMTDPADEITALRAQLAAAEADKLEAMQRVRDAAISALLKACSVAGSGYKDENERLLRRAEREAVLSSASAIRALDIDALAEGDE